MARLGRESRMVVLRLHYILVEVRASAYQVSLSKVSVAATITLLGMQSLAQLERSWSCAFSASGSVNVERRVLMALW